MRPPNPRTAVALSLLCCACAGALSAQENARFFEFAQEQSRRDYSRVPRHVLAFYYPWYGTPQRHGRWVHWEDVNPAARTIKSSTHYPALGAYDSHDATVVEKHIDTASRNGITGFIASWWGPNSFEDRTLPLILEKAATRSFHISVYWESVRGTNSIVDAAVADLEYLLTHHATHSAFLKVNGKPVIFMYTRVMSQVPTDSWPEIIQRTRSRAGDFLLIPDGYETLFARMFDGLHEYNFAHRLVGTNVAHMRSRNGTAYRAAVALARAHQKISCLTVLPGYDDTRIRSPGLQASRHDGDLYRMLWDEAVEAQPDWILITSWNEWHEGSEIEPSVEHGDRYLRLTRPYARRFLASPPVEVHPVPDEFLERVRVLRQFYAGKRVGLLPGAMGEAVFLLGCLGVDVQQLTWEQLTDRRQVNPQTHPLILYSRDESYMGTVESPDDVKNALIRYLSSGGFLVCMPTQPWPFFYDASQGNRMAPITDEIGLPIGGGIDRLSVSNVMLHINNHELAGFPAQARVPPDGDLRWRPSLRSKVAPENHYLSLVELRDSRGQSLGDAVAYIEYRSGPLAPGRTLYVWMRTANALGDERFFLALFHFLATRWNVAS